MDTGTGTGSRRHVWYERGFSIAKPETGLPPAEIPFQSRSHSNHWYVLAPHTNLNSILITSRSGETKGQFTLTSPAAFSALSFLVSAAWGEMSINVIVHHEDQSAQTNIVRVDDWAQGANPVWIAHGRYNLENHRFDSVDTNYWRLYARPIALTNTTSPVTHIEFVRRPLQGGNTAIFGVSGSTGNDFNPLAVTGFNQDIVIEASYTGFTIPNLLGQIWEEYPAIEVGGPITANLAIRNTGHAASPPTTVAVYVRSSDDPYDDAHKVGEMPLPSLEPTGTNQFFTFTFNSPPELAGLYDLSMWIDPHSEVPELFENDNQAQRLIGIGPNLNLGGSEPTLLTNGIPWELNFKGNITSGGAAAPPTRGAGFLATEGTTNTANAIKLGEFEIPALPAADQFPHPTYRFDVNFRLPDGLAPGTYFLIVQADFENNVAEVSETDNFTWGVSFQLPPGQPDSTPAIKIATEIVADEDSGPLRIPYQIIGFNFATLNQTLTLPATEHPFREPSLEGSGLNRTLVLPLKEHHNGEAVLQLKAEDGTNSITKTFTVILRPVDDPFEIDSLVLRILAAGSGPYTIPFMVRDIDTPLTELEYSITSNVPEMFGADGLKVQFVNGAFQLFIAPVSPEPGACGITVDFTHGQVWRTSIFGAIFVRPGITFRFPGDNSEFIEITAASALPATLETSNDLTEWTKLQDITPERGYRNERPSATKSEFFRLRATE